MVVKADFYQRLKIGFLRIENQRSKADASKPSQTAGKECR